MGPWTPTVHAFLRHLEAMGHPGAPRVLGLDEDGREVLSFLDGEVLAAGSTWKLGDPTPWPAWAQSEDCLQATAKLLRSLHDASSSFTPPADAVWRRHPSAAPGPGEVVCHGDIGPHNTVYRDGHPIGFIDWDTIRPEHPLVELGTALWKYVPLGTAAYFEASDFPSIPPLPRRVALFARAYGIDDPAQVRWSLHRSKVRSVEALRWFPVGPAEAAFVLRRVATDLEWLEDAVDSLVSEIG